MHAQEKFKAAFAALPLGFRVLGNFEGRKSLPIAKFDLKSITRIDGI